MAEPSGAVVYWLRSCLPITRQSSSQAVRKKLRYAVYNDTLRAQGCQTLDQEILVAGVKAGIPILRFKMVVADHF